MAKDYDAVIIGSGSNGLSAAIRLQQKGLKTLILEHSSTLGGSTKTEERTLPGFKHDVGSSILPLGLASPYLSTLPLEKYGLQWIFPEIPFSHPFEDGSAIACYKDIYQTADQLDQDKDGYLRLFKPLVKEWDHLDQDLLGPLGWPQKPLEFVKFGLKALPSAAMIADHYFNNNRTKAFFYGAAAHSTLPLHSLISSSFGLVLTTLAHNYGWPFPKGGAGNFIQALVGYYESLGGQIERNSTVTDYAKLPTSKAYLFDITPKQLLNIKGLDLSWLYKKRLKGFKYGAGVFKMDWALKEPIPFLNEKCRKSGTVHLGFSKQEMENSEKGIHKGNMTDTPYVLVAQHSLFDDTRAPEGMHTAWAYCHVPSGSTHDYTELIERQIERAAPGFRDIILKRSIMNTEQLQTFNPNIIAGDINGGKQDITQLFTRPIAKISPYKTADPKVYLCSSSTPPGGGVHGMCGFHAAEQAIKDHFS
ncbi:phytoene desaturase family protein [Flavimarina sp. Hel_I_48]|uniref:phytoene desaturase family protein n=1 Tax=Flavimarina sp. Hel_I_48 TaxID=1392488 RepID=UPI0004DF16D0|nr:NAD(P)/FAD-dependent oxidoreductase [Flavimarina sp. Hel_I_48]